MYGIYTLDETDIVDLLEVVDKPTYASLTSSSLILVQNVKLFISYHAY